jgi:hypothetical protein
MILVKFWFWSFCFYFRNRSRPRRCPVFRPLGFRDPARLRRAAARDKHRKSSTPRPGPAHEPPGSAGVSPAPWNCSHYSTGPASRDPKTGTRRQYASAPRNCVPVGQSNKNFFVPIPLSDPAFKLLPFPSFVSVHIGIEPGRRPALQNIEYSTLTNGDKRDALSCVIRVHPQ